MDLHDLNIGGERSGRSAQCMTTISSQLRFDRDLEKIDVTFFLSTIFYYVYLEKCKPLSTLYAFVVYSKAYETSGHKFQA